MKLLHFHKRALLPRGVCVLHGECVSMCVFAFHCEGFRLRLIPVKASGWGGEQTSGPHPSKSFLCPPPPKEEEDSPSFKDSLSLIGSCDGGGQGTDG